MEARNPHGRDKATLTLCMAMEGGNADQAGSTVSQSRKPEEGGAVIVHLKVAELMHDHVLDAVQRCLDQLRAERDGPRLRTASPAAVHLSNPQCGVSASQAGRRLDAAA